MANALAQLSKEIQQRRFRPVYYFYGDEEYGKEQALRALIAAAVDPATRDFNLALYRGGDIDAATLGTMLGTPPIMAQRRLVVVREFAALKKQARRQLNGYIERPASDVMLILIVAAGTQTDVALEKIAGAFEFTAPQGAEATAWIVDHAREVHGAEISPETAEVLSSAVGTDLAVLASEIDKLASFSEGRIDNAAVEAVVGLRRGESVADFLDAVVRRNAATALRIVPGVLAQPKMNVVLILMQLTTQLLALGYGTTLRQRGIPERALYGELMNLLRSTNPYVGGPWGLAVARWTRAIPRWSAQDISHGLRVLLDADRAAKDTRASSEEQLLKNVVLALCTPTNRAAA
ncbi:MAG: DNA polymerase III subunit delta [Gemmatimonadaceae bacterium]